MKIKPKRGMTLDPRKSDRGLRGPDRLTKKLFGGRVIGSLRRPFGLDQDLLAKKMCRPI